MELTVKSNNNGAQPKKTKKSKNTTTTIVVAKPGTKANAKPQKKNKPKKNKASLSLRDRFALGITRPDIMGPMRIPRPGGSTRTVLGYDKSYSNIGSVSNYFLVVGSTNYTESAKVYSAVDASTAFALTGNQSVGAQFPAYSSVTDANLVAQVMNITYVGAPLNVTGEIIMGTIPNSASPTLATWLSLATLATAIKMPLKDLIFDGDKTSKSVSLRKSSPAADEFRSVATPMSDVELPFFAITTTASANIVAYGVQRSWECRSQISTTNVVPYELSGNSFSADMSSFQDAVSDVAAVPVPVQDTYNENFERVFLASKLAGSVIASMSVAAMHEYYSRSHLRTIGMV